MAKNKTQKTDASVDDYLETIEPESKRDDCYRIIELMREATGSEPAMWGTSIIAFGECTMTYESGRVVDWFHAGFAPRSSNLTLYILNGFSEYDELLAKLGKHKTGKSCLYIKKLDDIHWATLKEMVEKSVAYMKETYPS